MSQFNPRSTLSHVSGKALSETQPHAIHFAAAPLLTTALPVAAPAPLPRVAGPEPEQQAERRAFRSLVSAACYLSFNAQADPEAVLEAIQILHDLATGIREDGGPSGAAGSDEDRIWETARSRWERQKLVDIAVRFVKSPHGTRRQQPKQPWQRFRETWRRHQRVQPS